MSTKLNCDIVRDLLPSYVDKLTSETTNEAVNEHLKECTECSEVLQRMKEPEKTGSEPKAEVNYLKKIRRRSLQKGFIVCAVLVIIAILAGSFKTFYLGKEAHVKTFYSSVSVTDNTVKLNGEILLDASAAFRTTFSEKDGVVDITVYSAPHSIINKRTFSKEYKAKNEVKTVRVNGLIKWENGVSISDTAAELYSLKNPYVGDIVADTMIASALGVINHFGGYSSELHTAAEPYGWTLILDKVFSPYNEEEVQKNMLRDSSVLIALIGNLDYVTWEYIANGNATEYTVTAEHASNFAGKNIKDFSSSAAEVQKLLDKLNINSNGKVDVLSNEVFMIKIKNNSEKEIREITMDYYLNGEIAGTQSSKLTNGESVPKGEFTEFQFIPQHFPLRTQNYDLQNFSFDLRVTDTDGQQYTLCENKKFPVWYDSIYYFSVESNESGFALTER